MTHLEETRKRQLERGFVLKFLEHTGYSKNDILSLSFETNIILTRNGGKYRVENDHIEHIAGPSPDPSERI